MICWLYFIDCVDQFLNHRIANIFWFSIRSHCYVETFNILLSFVIIQGLYVLIIVIFVLFFPSMVVKDYLPEPSGSCPGFVTLLFNAFVVIVVVPPSLYLACHRISVSDVINVFLDQNFLTTLWIVLLTWGLEICRLVSDRAAILMLNFIIESQTSLSVAKWKYLIPLTFW